MLDTLNELFNFPDEPEYHFFVLNFGPFIKFQEFIRLNYITCLSGPNGSGKSSLMDAVKTAIIANQVYLTFNPKTGHNTTLKDYLNLFGLKKKVGPTLLLFAVRFPTERHGYREAVFGIGWDRDIQGTYFYKENLSKKKVLPLIDDAISTKSFIRSLKQTDYPGKTHVWNTALEYHRFLDQQGVFFYFPKDYDDLSSYRGYLSLLNACTLALTSNKKIKIRDLKNHLFRPHKDKKELENSLHQIDRGLNLFYDFHIGREAYKTKLKSLDILIEHYKDYYTNVEAFFLAARLLELKQDRNQLEFDYANFEEKQESLSVKLEKKKVLLDNIDKELKKRNKEYEQIDHLYNEYKDCNKFFIENEEIFVSDYEDLNSRIEGLKREKEDIKKEIKTNNPILKRFKTLFENTTIEYENSKNGRKKQLEKQKELNREYKELDRQKNELLETKIGLKSIIKMIEKIGMNLKELKKQIKFWGFSDEKTLRKEIKTIKVSSNLKKNEIAEIKRKHSQLEQTLKINNVGQNSIEKIMKQEFGLKRFFEYYDNSKLDILKSHESVFSSLKDYYVVPASLKRKIPKILSKLNQIDNKVDLIILEETDNLFKVLKTEKVNEDKVIGRIFKDQIIVYNSEIDLPQIFGFESRQKYLKKLKERISKKEKELKILDKNSEEYNDLLTETEIRKQDFDEYQEKIETITNKKTNKDFLSSNENEIEELEEKLKITGYELGQIRSDEDHDKELLNLQTHINSNEKSLNNYTERIKKAEIKLQELTSNLEKLENKRDKLPAILEEGNKILNILIQNIQKFYPNQIFEHPSFLKKLSSIQLFLLDIRDKLKDLINTEKNAFSSLQMKITNIEEELEEISNNIIEFTDKIENNKEAKTECLASQKKLFQERLCHDITPISNTFSSWFSELILKTTTSINEEIKSQELPIDTVLQRRKNEYMERWGKIVNQVCIAYSTSIGEIKITDSDGRCYITNLSSFLNIDFYSLKTQEHLLDKIEDLDSKLEDTCKRFIADTSAFISIISSELRKFNHTKNRYNELAKMAHFGTIERVSFEINYKDQYKALKRFQSELENAEENNQLQEIIEQVVQNKSTTLVKYFSSRILNDPNAKEQSFLDIYQYFDFEIYNHGIEGNKRAALSGSGGESTGMKYLIYSLVFHSLRLKGSSSYETSYSKPLFIFFDEAAAVDEKGINSLIELASKLKINAVIAMVQAPRIHDKRLNDFILVNGIVTPGSSDIINRIDMGIKK